MVRCVASLVCVADSTYVLESVLSARNAYMGEPVRTNVIAIEIDLDKRLT